MYVCNSNGHMCGMMTGKIQLEIEWNWMQKSVMFVIVIVIECIRVVESEGGEKHGIKTIDWSKLRSQIG